jgi:hypothetical protein
MTSRLGSFYECTAQIEDSLPKTVTNCRKQQADGFRNYDPDLLTAKQGVLASPSAGRSRLVGWVVRDLIPAGLIQGKDRCAI